jgi:hypothetical protein
LAGVVGFDSVFVSLLLSDELSDFVSDLDSDFASLPDDDSFESLFSDFAAPDRCG